MSEDSMRILFCVASVVVLGVSGARGAPVKEKAADTKENRVKAVERYLKIVPIKSMMEDMAEELAKNSAPDVAAKIRKTLTEKVDFEALEKSMTEAMTKHFTVYEIDALADFYGSPEGRSIMKKFGKYMGELMPVIQQQVERALKDKD
jgi:hypothetical protein